MSMDETTTAPLPVFYQRPSPLNAEVTLDAVASFDFARTTNAVPINAVEFAAAQRDYPIVFSNDAAPVAMAVLGLEERRNLFVDRSGRWAEGCYVPAYVRRYPFIFMEAESGTEWVLCIDEAAAVVRDDGNGEALFSGGAPAVVTKQALEFCTAFQREAAVTRALATALLDAGLLEPSGVNIAHDGGPERALAGFQVIDETKLLAVPDATLLEWRQQGFLAPIHAQIFSAGAWAGLAARE
jgi:hypothetical protein